MNTYQITLANGATTLAMGEQYNNDPVTGLAILDQFGNATVTFSAGSFIGVQIVSAAAVAQSVQPGVAQIMTDSDQPNT